MDKEKLADVIFLDLSKTFDTTPHSILLDRLSNWEIKRLTLRWVMSWLNGRAQRAVLGGATSGWQLVISSAPQGSILGQVMLNIFNNDLDTGTESKSLLQSSW